MHFCISGAFFDLMKNRGVSVFLSPREEVVIPKFSQKWMKHACGLIFAEMTTARTEYWLWSYKFLDM
jgi:hypothetical protein